MSSVRKLKVVLITIYVAFHSLQQVLIILLTIESVPQADEYSDW
jgi:hypothetical protein